MGRITAGPKALALSACLCAAAVGCGDIGDAQLPLPIQRGGSRELAADDDLFASAKPATGPARAVVSLRLSAGVDAACPIRLEALLPDASATATLADGEGARAVDGQGAQIACRVVERLGSDGVFELSLSLQHEQLPGFLATGQLGPAPSGIVALGLTTPGGASITATCPVETDEVLNGAAWFHSVGCRTPASGPRAGACEVAISAIFESCHQ